jgi:hypothetical protein
MAQMPIEIVEVGDVPTDAIGEAVAFANSVQHEFVYSVLPPTDAEHFRVHAFRRMRANGFLDTMESIRKQLRGYHPYLLSIVDAELDGEDYGNIFGSNRAETGVGAYNIQCARGHCSK